MDLELGGRVVVVTGAARGIGRATVLTFAKEGAHVVISDIDLDAAKLVEEEATALGTHAFAVRADVTKPNEVRGMVDETLGRFKRLDILVNNAGVLYVDGKPVVRKLFQESTEEDWPGDINVTLYGVLNCTRAAIEPMLSQKSGSIINILSGAALAPAPRVSIYAAGKGSILSFSRNLAYELGPLGIRVNCVSPGVIRSTRQEAVESGAEKGRPEAVTWQKAFEELAKNTPLRRIGSPQELANIIVFLASDACSYVTGQTLCVDGGLIMP